VLTGRCRAAGRVLHGAAVAGAPRGQARRARDEPHPDLRPAQPVRGPAPLRAPRSEPRPNPSSLLRELRGAVVAGAASGAARRARRELCSEAEHGLQRLMGRRNGIMGSLVRESY